MKRCPQCGREYDNTISFCLDDGAELLYGPALSDEPATAIMRDPTSMHQPATDPIQTWHRRLLALPLILAVFAAGAIYVYRYLTISDSKQIESIAVMPFVNESGDPSVEYLSDGMTEILINTLSQMPNLSVKSRNAVFRYKGKEADAAVVGKDLGVQAILTGRVIQRGDGLTVYLELVDTRVGNRIWGEQYLRKPSDLIALQREIALDVSQKLQLKLSSGDQQRLGKTYTASAEALQLYLKGRFYWLKFPAKEYENARDFYEQAINADPAFALAYGGLSEYYGFGAAKGFLSPAENWPKSKAAAEKALQLDDSIGAAHNALAGVMQFNDDRRGAEEVLKRAIAIDPNYIESRFHYSQFLDEEERFEESMAELKTVLESEPLSVRSNRALGIVFVHTGDFTRAVDQFQKTLELEPNDSLTHELLGNAFEQQDRKADAIAEWRKALALSEDVETAATLLGQTFAANGFDAAVRVLWTKRLEQLSDRTSRGEYVPAMDYARAYTRLGDKDRALLWLGRAVEERNALKFDFKLEPIYETLRSDPRSHDFLNRIKRSG